MENDNESWLKDPKQLESVAKRLESEHGALQAETKGYLRCYYDRPVTGADYTRPYRELAVFQTLRESHGGNLTREVIDAAASIICRPLSAEVLPKGAEFELEQGCKQASRLIEGVFDNSDFTSIAKRAFKDGCTASIGPAKAVIDPLTEEIKFERVNPLELYWPDDGTDEPRTLMQISPVSRDKLMALYPQHKGRIKDLPPWSPATIVGVDPPGTRKDVGTAGTRASPLLASFRAMTALTAASSKWSTRALRARSRGFSLTRIARSTGSRMLSTKPSNGRDPSSPRSSFLRRYLLKSSAK
jgi:hypothetical protein